MGDSEGPEGRVTWQHPCSREGAAALADGATHSNGVYGCPGGHGHPGGYGCPRKHPNEHGHPSGHRHPGEHGQLLPGAGISTAALALPELQLQHPQC